MIDQKKIGNRLYHLRKQKGMSQQEIADQIGVSLKHYSELERGLSGMSLDLLEKLTKCFSESTDFILFGYRNCLSVGPEYEEKYRSLPTEKKEYIRTHICSMLDLLQ